MTFVDKHGTTFNKSKRFQYEYTFRHPKNIPLISKGGMRLRSGDRIELLHGCGLLYLESVHYARSGYGGRIIARQEHLKCI